MKKRIVLCEEELVEAISNKSRIGAEALYHMYSGSLYGVIFKMVRNTAMAEDVLQQSFIKIWYSFEMYHAEKGRLFTWMLCISRNLARDTMRSKQYKQFLYTDPIEFYEEKNGPFRDTVLRMDINCIKRNVENLKKDHRDILNLIYFEGFTHAEVAGELHIPIGTVKTRCRIAINILREIFKEPPANSQLILTRR